MGLLTTLSNKCGKIPFKTTTTRSINHKLFLKLVILLPSQPPGEVGVAVLLATCYPAEM